MCEVQESVSTLVREGEDSRSQVFNLKFEVQGQREQRVNFSSRWEGTAGKRSGSQGGGRVHVKPEPVSPAGNGVSCSRLAN